MKKIYLVSDDKYMREDVLKTIDSINENKYRVVEKNLNQLEDVFEEFADLAVLPLDWEPERKMGNKIIPPPQRDYNNLLNFRGISLAKGLQENRFSGKIILTIEGSYSLKFDEKVRRLFNPNEESYLRLMSGTPFVNLYSRVHSEDAKKNRFLNSLEGKPQ